MAKKKPTKKTGPPPVSVALSTPDVAETPDTEGHCNGASEENDKAHGSPSPPPQKVGEKSPCKTIDASPIETPEVALSPGNAEAYAEPPLAPASAPQELDPSVTLLREQLAASQAETLRHKTQYDILYNRLSQVKHVIVKLKQTEALLEQTQAELAVQTSLVATHSEKLAGLTTERDAALATLKALQGEASDLNGECDRLGRELSKLRREGQVREDAASRESDSLVSTNHQLSKRVETLKSEVEEGRVALQEEQHTSKELSRRIEDLEAVVLSQTEEMAVAVAQNASASQTIASLERDLQEAARMRLQSDALHEATVLTLQKQLMDAMGEVEVLETKLQEVGGLQLLLDESVKDAHNKQLQIGKLRHEAIILNEHLTKALKLIKKDHETENVDKQLITNLFLQFLAIQRGDKKKFQVLQLISGILGWDEHQQRQAGLVGHVKGEEKVRESFVGLWTEFLEKESKA